MQHTGWGRAIIAIKISQVGPCGGVIYFFGGGGGHSFWTYNDALIWDPPPGRKNASPLKNLF